MRFFAILPAAGNSRRMGQPKLLLPLPPPPGMDADGRQERPLIHWTLAAWKAAGAEAVVAVVRQADDALADVCGAGGARVVRPSHGHAASVGAVGDPIDMKASVALGLDFIRQEFSPVDEDCWMLAPADIPLLRPRTIRAVMEACETTPQSVPVLPICRGKRGHPAAFPWRLAAEVGQLGPEQGVNALFNRWPPQELELDDGLDDALCALASDVDTPEQYHQLRDSLLKLLTDETENP